MKYLQSVEEVAAAICAELGLDALAARFVGVSDLQGLHRIFTHIHNSQLGTTFTGPYSDYNSRSYLSVMGAHFKFGAVTGVKSLTIREFDVITPNGSEIVDTLYSYEIVRNEFADPDAESGRLIHYHIDYDEYGNHQSNAVILWDDHHSEYVSYKHLDMDRVPVYMSTEYPPEPIYVVRDKNDGLIYLDVSMEEIGDKSRYHRSQQDAAYRRRGYYLPNTDSIKGPRFRAIKAERVPNSPGEYYVQLDGQAARPQVKPLSPTEESMLEFLCQE